MPGFDAREIDLEKPKKESLFSNNLDRDAKSGLTKWEKNMF